VGAWVGLSEEGELFVAVGLLAFFGVLAFLGWLAWMQLQKPVQVSPTYVRLSEVERVARSLR